MSTLITNFFVENCERNLSQQVDILGSLAQKLETVNAEQKQRTHDITDRIVEL